MRTLAVLALLLVGACGGGEWVPPPAEVTLTVLPSADTIRSGETMRLRVVIRQGMDTLPCGGTLTWAAASQDSILRLDPLTGDVVGVKVGTDTVTATCDSVGTKAIAGMGPLFQVAAAPRVVLLLRRGS